MIHHRDTEITEILQEFRMQISVREQIEIFIAWSRLITIHRPGSHRLILQLLTSSLARLFTRSYLRAPNVERRTSNVFTPNVRQRSSQIWEAEAEAGLEGFFRND